MGTQHYNIGDDLKCPNPHFKFLTHFFLLNKGFFNDRVFRETLNDKGLSYDVSFSILLSHRLFYEF